MNRRLLMIAPLALTAACGEHLGGYNPPYHALADMRDGLGTQMGTARLVDRGDHSVLILDMRGVAPGLHGIHLHAVGACEGPDFTSAGPHLNPDGHRHGSRNRAGPHMGDLPNVRAEKGGGWIRDAITIDVPTAVLDPQLFDADGTAIVLHAGRDDYRTDPSGNSGKRIACGVLRRP